MTTDEFVDQYVPYLHSAWSTTRGWSTETLGVLMTGLTDVTLDDAMNAAQALFKTGGYVTPDKLTSGALAQFKHRRQGQEAAADEIEASETLRAYLDMVGAGSLLEAAQMESLR